MGSEIRYQRTIDIIGEWLINGTLGAVFLFALAGRLWAFAAIVAVLIAVRASILYFRRSLDAPVDPLLPAAQSPREPLPERFSRLMRGRRAAAFFALPLVFALVMIANASWHSGNALPFVAAVIVFAVGLAIARLGTKRRESEGMASRSETVQSIALPSRWPSLDAAVATYVVLTGKAAPRLALFPRSRSVDRVDATLDFFSSTPDERGQYVVASPYAPGDAVPWYVFTEAMLDDFVASEILVVMVHLMHRAEFARGGSARLANGVCESDSKALLMTREHAPLLSAIEKSAHAAGQTAAPGTGLICFGDADLRASDLGNTGRVTKWAARDRVQELRSHLGALAVGATGDSAGN